jgi:hypothetical protein
MAAIVGSRKCGWISLSTGYWKLRPAAASEHLKKDRGCDCLLYSYSITMKTRSQDVRRMKRAADIMQSLYSVAMKILHKYSLILAKSSCFSQSQLLRLENEGGHSLP